MGAATKITVTLPPELRSLLESLTGETTDKKIAYLLLRDLRHKLAMSEQERLDLEMRYGMEYAEFKEQLEAGLLGDEFSYDLEQDALRWEDLIAEKRYRLQQLQIVKELLE
jgi:hypothetical protein